MLLRLDLFSHASCTSPRNAVLCFRALTSWNTHNKVSNEGAFAKVPINTASGSEGGKLLAFFFHNFYFFSIWKCLDIGENIIISSYVDVL